MAKILLISCNVTEEPYPVYPLGVSAVAAAARRRGHQVAVRDLLVRSESDRGLAKAVGAESPDVIGLSLRNIDNVDSMRLEFYADRYEEIVRELREEVSCPIVLGGAGYSLFPSELLEALRADFGVVGEGERAFCDLVDALADGRSPERRIWTAPDLLDGEGFAVPEREEALASHYLREGGMLNVQTKRGCPHRCAYCAYPCLEGRAYRFRSPVDAVDEVEMLRDRYGADYIAFSDSVFNDAEGRYLEIAEELVRREIAIPWMAFLRPQRFRREEVALLKLAGLAGVEWGTDCSTDATLGAMGKDFTWAEVEESNRLFALAGIPNAHFIMFGGPGETEDTAREGLANIERLEGCVVFAFRGVRILPGTGIHRRAVEEGVVADGESLLKPRFYHSPEVTEDCLDAAIANSFAPRRDRIYPPGQDMERIQAFHRMGRRGPIWDLLLANGRKERRGRQNAGRAIS